MTGQVYYLSNNRLFVMNESHPKPFMVSRLMDKDDFGAYVDLKEDSPHQGKPKKFYHKLNDKHNRQTMTDKHEGHTDA